MRPLLLRILTVVMLVMTMLPSIITGNHLFFPVSVEQRTAKPAPAPARWRPLLGEYVLDSDTVIVLESGGKLCALFKKTELLPLRAISANVFEFEAATARAGERVVFSRNPKGSVTQVTIGKTLYKRRPL